MWIQDKYIYLLMQFNGSVKKYGVGNINRVFERSKPDASDMSKNSMKLQK